MSEFHRCRRGGYSRAPTVELVEKLQFIDEVAAHRRAELLVDFLGPCAQAHGQGHVHSDMAPHN